MTFALTQEQEQFRSEVRAWVDTEFPKDKARAAESASAGYPDELWSALSKAGYHGLSIAPEHGGSHRSAMDHVILCRELSRTLGGMTWVWATSAFCGGHLIQLFGSDEQKSRLLPALARGELRAAISASEPGGGTDLLGAMQTTAERTEDGWVINGDKIWSTSSGDSDFLVVLAKTGEDAKKARGKTLLMVPTNAAGIEFSPLPKLGFQSVPTYRIALRDVHVPADAVLGDVGGGFYQLAKVLTFERILVAAMALGMLDGVLEDSVSYLKERHAYGKPIGAMQSLQHYVADMAIWQRQGELLTYHAAEKYERGEDTAMDANIAKIATSEQATQAADLGMQILGGLGYSLETDMQRYWRDARLLRIAPITNEASRNQLAESFGLPRSF